MTHGPAAMRIIPIISIGDVVRAKREARAMAQEMGFADKEAEDITLAVTEMSTNMVKHAGGGTLYLDELNRDGKRGIYITSKDSGPGIADIEDAMGAGFSTSGTLGSGLGMINAAMDELNIQSGGAEGNGTILTCVKWLRRQKQVTHNHLDVGASTRPKPGMSLNGDAFVIKKWGNKTLVSLIDGLGHGQYAHRAANSIRNFVEDHYDEPLESMFRRAGYACRATRGAVMAVARFDFGSGEMEYASVGNIEARVIGTSDRYNFIIRRGIVGKSAPNPVITRHPWCASNIMILYSDGVRSHWEWSEYSYLAEQPAQQIAAGLLKSLARENDDATVVVVKGAANE